MDIVEKELKEMEYAMRSKKRIEKILNENYSNLLDERIKTEEDAVKAVKFINDEVERITNQMVREYGELTWVIINFLWKKQNDIILRFAEIAKKEVD